MSEGTDLKHCNICDTTKLKSDFGFENRSTSKLRFCCKECRKREYNALKKSEYNKNWYKINREKQMQNAYRYVENNKEKVREYKKSYDKLKAKENQEYRIKRSLRARLRSVLKDKPKKGSAIKELGCSVSEFKSYLESKFLFGMNWENYGSGKGKWQIDHIRPIRSFDLLNEVDFKKANHYTNLQPLWHNEHVIKTRSDREVVKNANNFVGF